MRLFVCSSSFVAGCEGSYSYHIIGYVVECLYMPGHMYPWHTWQRWYNGSASP